MKKKNFSKKRDELEPKPRLKKRVKALPFDKTAILFKTQIQQKGMRIGIGGVCKHLLFKWGVYVPI